MASERTERSRGLLLAVLPAVCYLAGRLLLKRLLALALPSLSDALQALVIAALMLPVALLFAFSAPKEGSKPKASALRLLAWALGLLCLAGLVFCLLQARNADALGELLAVCLLAPIAEELIYRGAVLRRAQRHLPVFAAFLLSALLFAAGHASLLQAAIAVPAGLVFCLLADRTGSLLTPTLLHILWNLLAAWLFPIAI